MSKSKIVLMLLLFSASAYTSPEPETLGTFYSSGSGYLKLATYVTLNNFGPYKISPKQKQNSSFYKLSKTEKICFNINELREFIPNNMPPNESYDYLPTTDKTSVVPHSGSQPDPETFCYLLKKGSSDISEEDFKVALKESNALFSSFNGIEGVPEENRKELVKIWNKRRSVERKVKRLAKYWQHRIKYTPESLNLLLNYVKENPDQNILQAIFKYKVSDCGPKNFALGLSIWELSNRQIPVRLNYAIWLRPTSKNEIQLTTDRLHIHVEYLTKNKNGQYQWKTAETAFNTNVYRKIYRN